MKHSKNVHPGYFSLSPNQRRFKRVLAGYPSLLPFWNFLTCECDVHGLRLHMDALSYDEQQMARFFVTMWQPGNELEFDVMHAVWNVGDSHWQVIQDWMATLEHPEVSLRMMHTG